MNEEQTPAPEQATETLSRKNESVIVMPRTILNYVVIAVTFLLIGGIIGSQAFGAQDSALTEAAVERIVRQVLSETDFSQQNSDRFELVGNSPYLGAEDAPIVIVEFSDFRCPYCGRHYEMVLDPILENYGEHIRYVYRNFAALGPESTQSALAAQCANEQGAFWEFHNIFFENPNLLGRDFYIQTAEENELDVEEFTVCLDDARYMGDISSDLIDGQLNGVTGTPGFFINGNFIRGAQPYEVFERVIQRELTRAGISFTEPGATS